MDIKKDVSVFYSMMCLIKSAENMGKFLVESQSVTRQSKMEINQFRTKIKRFMNDICDQLPADKKQAWLLEFKEKDFESITNMLYMIADMDDEHRAIAEEFLTQLTQGNINVIN